MKPNISSLPESLGPTFREGHQRSLLLWYLGPKKLRCDDLNSLLHDILHYPAVFVDVCKPLWLLMWIQYVCPWSGRLHLYLSKPDIVFDLVVDLWEKLCCPYSHPEFAAKAKIKHHSGELLVIVGAYQVSIFVWNSCSSLFHIQVKTNAQGSQDLKVKSCQNCVIKHVKTVLKPWNKH